MGEATSIAKQFLNSTIGTGNPVPLNEQHGRKTFTTDGIFRIPQNVTSVLVTAIAAGGDGAAGGGSGGSCGEFILDKTIIVDGANEISITVGNGNTVLDGYLVLLKGNGTIAGGAAGVKGGDSDVCYGGEAGIKGSDAHFSAAVYKGGAGGGGGGASPWGSGGAGENGGNGSVNFNKETQDGKSGAPGLGYGAGGGAGGGRGNHGYGSGSAVDGAGGKGSPGIVIIEW